MIFLPTDDYNLIGSKVLKDITIMSSFFSERKLLVPMAGLNLGQIEILPANPLVECKTT